MKTVRLLCSRIEYLQICDLQIQLRQFPESTLKHALLQTYVQKMLKSFQCRKPGLPLLDGSHRYFCELRTKIKNRNENNHKRTLWNNISPRQETDILVTENRTKPRTKMLRSLWRNAASILGTWGTMLGIRLDLSPKTRFTHNNFERKLTENMFLTIFCWNPCRTLCTCSISRRSQTCERRTILYRRHPDGISA